MTQSNQDLEAFHEEQARNYLDHIRAVGAKLRVINGEIEQLNSQLTLSGIDYNEHVSGGMVNKDAIPDGVARMVELIDEYRAQQLDYVKEQAVFHDVLDALDEQSALIISQRWIENNPWDQVAEVIGYSRVHVHRLLHAALQEVYVYMPAEYKSVQKAV